jgi:hypothetical protein
VCARQRMKQRYWKDPEAMRAKQKTTNRNRIRLGGRTQFYVSALPAEFQPIVELIKETRAVIRGKL